MSKKSKSASKQLNKKKKAARKAQNRAKYETFMREGKNTKSKRSRMDGKRNMVLQVRDHPHGPCGNTGCIKCQGLSFKPFLRGNTPYQMPHWMYLRWREEQATA